MPFEPGNKHGHRFQPGVSGNAGGRPAVAREVRRLCQEKSKRAYEIVAGLMENAEKDSVRLAAAIAILRMAGVPMNEVVPAQAEQEKPLTPNASEQDLLNAATQGEG